MYIHFNGKVYKDKEDIDAQMLFDKVEKTGQYPSTSAPSPSDFYQFFDRDEPSIYIGVSSQLSSTYHNAQIAQQTLQHRKIVTVDAKSFSTGFGQVVIEACEYRDRGLGFDDLYLKINQLILLTRGIFILDKLDYLFHGGRCSAIENVASSVLKIRPFLEITPDGTLAVIRKVRGKRDKAFNHLWSYFRDQLNTMDIKQIFLTHLDCDSEIQRLKELISSEAPEIPIDTAQIGCVLATHSGPKPLGIAYSVY
jgi:DegV family protein with EDD domain